MTTPTTLKKERRRRGLTQLQLAVRAGCSLNTVALVERGGPLSAAMAQRLANALEVPVAKIFASVTDGSRGSV